MKLLNIPYSTINDRTIFEKVVQLAIVLVSMQFLLSLIDINITFGYFILPIIFVVIKYDRTQVNIISKLQLHFVITISLLLLAFGNMPLVYEIANLLYLGGYVLAICRNINNQYAKSLSYDLFNFIGFYSFYIIAGSVICVFYLLMDLFDKSFGVSSSFLFKGIDLVAIVFLSLTLIGSRAQIEEVNVDASAQVLKELSSNVEVNVEHEVYAERIVQYFEASEDYLDTSFSLDHLAKELLLSKQQVSEVINQNLNTSFYQLLAKYRINHAKVLIEEKQNLTIEAIVDECGFSSKSTFNKYFKYFVGKTPSVYRSYVA